MLSACPELQGQLQVSRWRILKPGLDNGVAYWPRPRDWRTAGVRKHLHLEMLRWWRELGLK
jgi:hypothetical protein